jgi:hypothetical protein
LFTLHIAPNPILNQRKKTFERERNMLGPYFAITAVHVGIKAEWTEAMGVEDNCDIPVISALQTIEVPGRQRHCVDKRFVSIGSRIVGKLIENGEIADIPSLGTNEELLHEQGLGIRVGRPRFNRIK